MILGISLLELLIAIVAFAITAYLINRFVPDPYRRWGLIAVAIFAAIYLCERLGVFRILSSVQI